MDKKKMINNYFKMKKENKPYCCPACGSSSFFEEGFGRFKVPVTIWPNGSIESGDYAVDSSDSIIKCAQCCKKYEF